MSSITFSDFVVVAMGSESDLPIMNDAIEILRKFEVAHQARILSAHRTPFQMLDFAKTAIDSGVSVIIAGAGGAAHLPGMLASATTLPVIGVPISLKQLDGLDSLLSIVQMPKGVPVATVAINNAANAALLAIRILSISNPTLQTRMQLYQQEISSISCENDLKLQNSQQ